MSFNYMKGFEPVKNEDYKYSVNCTGRLYNCKTEKEFESLISETEKSGFELLQKRKTENTSFAMAKKDALLVTMLFANTDKTVFVSEEINGKVPMLSGAEYGNECKTTFYAFENDHSLIDCGMCLLMQCSDYSFFVVDSGHYFQFNDNDRIYRFMRERTPKGKKVVVNGWFITHGHTDHVSKLIDFLNYNTGDVIIEGFYHNILAPDYPNDEWCDEEKIVASRAITAMQNSGAPVYTLHTGERAYIRNFYFDVLNTHEDVYPGFVEDYNDSSVVIMLNVENTKIFIPGDGAVEADKILTRRFPNELKADIVQVAHHGHTGLSTEAYEKIGASVAIFAVTKIMFDGEYERREANRKAVEIADGYYITSDGTVEIPLPYSKGNVRTLPDETFEDFEKIKRIWKYEYSEEYKNELYERFIKNGGSLENQVFPAVPSGYIEPK